MRGTNLRKVGGSVMLVIPPAILDLLHLKAGASVELAVDAGHLVVSPEVRPRYTLDELLTQCDKDAAVTEEDLSWIALPRRGREL